MAIRPFVFLPPVIFATLAGLFFIAMQRENPDDLPSTFIGQAPPPVGNQTLTTTSGVSADALAAGDITLVNFWASWCPPCRAEHPRLLQLSKQGVSIAGVNM